MKNVFSPILKDTLHIFISESDGHTEYFFQNEAAKLFSKQQDYYSICSYLSCWEFVSCFQCNYFCLYLWMLRKYLINMDSSKHFRNADFSKILTLKEACLILPSFYHLRIRAVLPLTTVLAGDLLAATAS